MNSENKMPVQQPLNSIGKKRKQAYRFNWFDILVAVIVIAAIVFGAWFFSQRGGVAGITSETAKVTYKIEFQRVIADVKDAPRAGDEVRDAIKRYRLGKVVHVESSEQIELVEDTISGKVIESVSPGLYTVILTIEADAVINDGRVTVDGETIAVGSRMVIRTPHFSGEGYCIGLETE